MTQADVPRERASTSIARWSLRIGCAIVALACLESTALNAQGSLASQGFGYPIGMGSIRTIGTGGSFGEFDVISPINPSALGNLTRTVVTVQTEPEFRSLQFNGLRESNRFQRVPLVLIAFPLPRNMGIGISASGFLDRTGTTVTTGQANLGDQVLPTNDSTDIRGSIADLRLGYGWRVHQRVSVGAGLHVFTGSNDVAVSRQFTDTLLFGSVVDSTTAVFFGSAYSVGADVRLASSLSASLSYRLGNDMTARVRNVVRSRGTIPTRVGGALRYEGIPGSIFALGIEQISWSDLDGLGSSAVQTFDATNWKVGAEVAGPKLREAATMFRAGFARSTLPFGVNGSAPRENRLAAGVGIPVAMFFTATLDLSVQRATRSIAGSSARERSYLFGLGIQLRP